MGRDIFEKRLLEFSQTVSRLGRLPRAWEVSFSDGEDQRLFFNKTYRLEKYSEFLDEILNKYNVKVLSDKEKESEFLDHIGHFNRVPVHGESYFSDGDDMSMWYLNYKGKHNDFETTVHDSLREYQDLDLAAIWPRIKDEVIGVIKQVKKIPEHGKFFTQDGIDIRTIFDKLDSYDPEFVEKVLLHLETYNKKALSVETRVEQLLTCVETLGYVPELREAKFSDKTDMFTWYSRYKENIEGLEEMVQSKTSTTPPGKKVNIYLIPNFRNKGGKFYSVCTNYGERLDLSNITSFEDAFKMDSSFTKRGGLILKRDEKIGSVSFLEENK